MPRLGKGDGWLRGLPPVFQRLCTNAVVYNADDPTEEADVGVFGKDLTTAGALCSKMFATLTRDHRRGDTPEAEHAVEGLWRCTDVLQYDRCRDGRARRAAACRFLRAAAEGPGRRDFRAVAQRVTWKEL